MSLVLPILPAPTGLVGLVGELKRRPIPAPTVTPATVKAARAVWAAIRGEHGFKADGSVRLLSAPDSNVKLRKGETAIYGLNLSPAISSGLINTCVFTRDCEAVCVLRDARGSWSSTMAARAARTELLFRARESFAIILADELQRAAAKAARTETEWRVRLNVGSDIPYEIVAPWLITMIGELGGRVYDYTKAWSRGGRDDYSVTLSADGRHDVATIVETVRGGRNVAVVVDIPRGAPLPNVWHGVPAIDGDLTDDRTTDPRGVVVLLRAKGKLRGVPAGSHPLVKAAA